MYPTVLGQSTISLDYKSVVIFNSSTTLGHANYYKLYLVKKATSVCYTYQVPTMMSEEHIKALQRVGFELCVSDCGLGHVLHKAHTIPVDSSVNILLCSKRNVWKT